MYAYLMYLNDKKKNSDQYCGSVVRVSIGTIIILSVNSYRNYPMFTN